MAKNYSTALLSTCIVILTIAVFGAYWQAATMERRHHAELLDTLTQLQQSASDEHLAALNDISRWILEGECGR